MCAQIGKDIFFDLVDHDKVWSFRIKKQMPFMSVKVWAIILSFCLHKKYSCLVFDAPSVSFFLSNYFQLENVSSLSYMHYMNKFIRHKLLKGKIISSSKFLSVWLWKYEISFFFMSFSSFFLVSFAVGFLLCPLYINFWECVSFRSLVSFSFGDSYLTTGSWLTKYKWRFLCPRMFPCT